MTSKKESAIYTHGHPQAAVGDHALRGAANSYGFLIPHIKPHFTILDVGCGPGSITVDFAELVPQGSIIGIDAVESVLEQARSNAKGRGLSNVEFKQADANDLPFKHGTFDVVFCHQVLQHVGQPVEILKEMRRVAKPGGGIVAAREACYSMFAWIPEPPLLDRWLQLYIQVARANGGEPNAGKYLVRWAREAGFTKEDVEASWDTWRYSERRAEQFSKSHGGRIVEKGFLGTAERNGFATEEDVKAIQQAWYRWGVDEEACINIPNAQILCRKS